MSEVIERLCRENRQSCIRRCAEGRCSLDLRGVAAEDHVIISPNQVLGATEENRCDCLVFWDRCGLRVIPVELKGGGYHARQVVEQLRSGARIAESLLGTRPFRDFTPLLLCGRRSTAEFKVLGKKESRVFFRNVYYYVKVRNCGSPLTQILGG